MLPYEMGDKAKTKVAISIRTDLTPLNQSNAKFVATLVEQIRNEKLDPVFYCQVARDLEGVRTFAEANKAELIEALPNDSDRFETALALFDQCAAVVSNRLHVLMIGASRGALPIACQSERNGKIQGAFEEGELCYIPIDYTQTDLPPGSITRILQSTSAERFEGAFAKSSKRVSSAFDKLSTATSDAKAG